MSVIKPFKRRLIKKVYVTLVYPFVASYLKKERSYNYNGFNLKVFPGVFHPGFFFSTKYLCAFICTKNIENKKCLELGSGTGLISLLMSSKKAHVTAVDISELAVQNTLQNFELNKEKTNQPLRILKSDLFSNVPISTFDFIIVNPPYYFADPVDETEHTWYCGINGEYFKRFFSQLSNFINEQSLVYIILAESCEIDRIKNIAFTHGFLFTLEESKIIWWEENYIFRIHKTNVNSTLSLS